MQCARVFVAIVAALTIYACGEESSDQAGGGTGAGAEAPQSAGVKDKELGPLAGAVEPLSDAGFQVVEGAEIFSCGMKSAPPSPQCDSDVIGNLLDAEKDGAEFTVAVFEEPAQAAEWGSSYVGPGTLSDEMGFPAEIDGNVVFYSGKCCTGDEPPPKVPAADYDEFVSITGGAS
jgi:hypothetical protein